MSGTTWTKFYWSDWKSDPKLRLCSYAARGLWIELLCVAAEHDPIGYVAVAGRNLNETDIARLTGGSECEVRALLGELEQNGVFSRDRQGRIYSRRMVADAKKAAIARKNGKLGGNPNLGKQTDNPASDNPPDNTPHNTHKPVTSYQLPEKKEKKPSVSKRNPPELFCPTDWQPGDNHRETAARLGITAAEFEREAIKFKSREHPGGRTNWNLAFTNWLGQAATFKAERNPVPLKRVSGALV